MQQEGAPSPKKKDQEEAIQQLAAWYQRLLIPTDNPVAFAHVNQPDWSSPLSETRGDSLLYTSYALTSYPRTHCVTPQLLDN